MPEVLEEFEFAVCTLGKHRSAEWLHDLLNRHRLPSELILRRAVCALLASANAARCIDVGITRRVQRRPFQRVAGRCTFPSISIVQIGDASWEIVGITCW